MPDAAIYAVAAILTLVAIGAVALAAWRTGAAAWRDRRLKQRRGGYIELQPTPDRDRLGISPHKAPRRGYYRPGPDPAKRGR